MFVNIMCNIQACYNILANIYISRCAYQLYSPYSPQTALRQEEEILPFVPDEKAFISTYCFLPVAGQFAVVQRRP